MARGPKPEPAAVKRAKGNPGRRKVGADPEHELEAGAPASKRRLAVTPPAWLEGDGLVIWQRLAPVLTGIKLLTPIDAETFARYCRSHARWLEMHRLIDEQGLTYHVETNHGKWDRPHPLLMAVDRLEVRLIAFEDRFGLNPAERQRIFAARAAGKTGDLFSEPAPSQAPAPSEPARPSSPVGLLN